MLSFHLDKEMWMDVVKTLKQHTVAGGGTFAQYCIYDLTDSERIVDLLCSQDNN